MHRILKRRPSPAMVVALIALFIAMGGVSYGLATGSIDSREIRNNSVSTRDLRNNNIRGKDIRRSTIVGSDVASNTLRGADIDESSLDLAVAKGFATINGANANGATTVLNFGGQQTTINPPGVTAQREVSGTYLVTFRGTFVGVDSVDDLTIQATGENFSNESAQGVSANQNEIVIRVRLRTFNGNAPANEDFGVQFYSRTG